MKDIDYLFLSCIFFRHIWYGISNWLRFIVVSSWTCGRSFSWAWKFRELF